VLHAYDAWWRAAGGGLPTRAEHRWARRVIREVILPGLKPHGVTLSYLVDIALPAVPTEFTAYLRRTTGDPTRRPWYQTLRTFWARYGRWYRHIQLRAGYTWRGTDRMTVDGVTLRGRLTGCEEADLARRTLLQVAPTRPPAPVSRPVRRPAAPVVPTAQVQAHIARLQRQYPRLSLRGLVLAYREHLTPDRDLLAAVLREVRRRRHSHEAVA
jgi:hypothetical protein